MEYRHNCKNCNKEFKSSRPQSKFCSANCRVTFGRSKIQKKEDKVIELTDRGDRPIIETPATSNPDKKKFIPNWKRSGFKSKEDAVLHAIGMLMEKSKALKKHGLTDSVKIIWKDKVIEI